MKFLTAEEFKTMVDRMVKESPWITQGEAAVALYQAQENFNKEEQAKARKQLTELRKEVFKRMEIKA
jgi:hypothetical protein